MPDELDGSRSLMQKKNFYWRFGFALICQVFLLLFGETERKNVIFKSGVGCRGSDVFFENLISIGLRNYIIFQSRIFYFDFLYELWQMLYLD